MPKLTLSFKGNILRILAVRDGPMTIGRDPSCDIHIDSLALQPVHARLVTSNGDSILQDNHSEGGTFVNHKPIEEQQLADNDIIRVGKHVLRFNTADLDSHEQPVLHDTPPAFSEAPARFTTSSPSPVQTKEQATATRQAPAPRHASANGWLQILNGKHLGKTLKLKSGLTNLGKHGLQPALITLRNDGYFISRLGEDEIAVGNHDIGEKTWPLHNGDMIRIGQMQLQFYLQDN